jgi:predicted RNA-binding protein with PIN domain
MLIETLIEYRNKKGHNITVVFDGWKTGEAQENQSVIREIRVIYSRLGEKADSVIKRIISTERARWVVVTSDRDIAAYAWSSGSVPISSEDFLNTIRKEQPEESTLYDEDEEDYVKPNRKGNPRKPSKKEKAIKQTLSKL